MTTVAQRLEWWRKKSYYLGDEVSVNIVNRTTYDSNGNEIKSSTVVADITIYTRSGSKAVERMERWIVPDADITNYLTKNAYKRNYTISSAVRHVILFRRRYRRWWW